MNRATGLERTEGLFWDLITAPEGVRPGLDDLVRRGVARPDDLEGLIAGDDRLGAAERLDIYANMYFFRLLDCLKEDYPRLLEAIGPDRFHNLVTDYLLECPSAHPSLRYLGARLPGFLASHALGREAPCLIDLARLEWARANLFDAADAPALQRDDLARLPQERAGEARLRLIPAFALLQLDHDAPRLWRELRQRAAGRAGAEMGAEAAAGVSATPSAAGAESAGEHWAAGQANAARLDDGEPARTCQAGHVHDEWPAAPLPEQRRRATAARVWRRGFIVYHRAIDAEEADALGLAAGGAPLARLAQRVSAGRSTGRATERFGRMLQSWIDDGLLAGPADSLLR